MKPNLNLNLNLNVKSLINGKTIKHNLPPNALVYTGTHTGAPFHMDLITYQKDHFEERKLISFKEMVQMIEKGEKNPHRVMWLNISGLNHPEDMDRIMHHFNINKHIMEQILNIQYHSKYEVHHANIYNRFQMLSIDDKGLNNETLSLYLSGNLIITFQEKAGDVFEPIRDRIRKGTGIVREQSVNYLHYSIVAALLDHYVLVSNSLNYQIDLLEQAIIDDKPMNLGEIHQIRKGLLLLKSATFPLEHIADIYPLDGVAFPEGDHLHWEKIESHVAQLMNIILVSREIVNSLYETYMMNMSNDMNKIMTTLTIFSAIFIPLSFLAGVFGMNFANMPALNNPHGFNFFLAGCGGILVLMIVYFRKNSWF